MMKVVIAMARLYRSSYSRRCGKRRYPTRDDALLALASCKGSANDRREECRAYPCPRCSGWHLTSIANAEGLAHRHADLCHIGHTAQKVGLRVCAPMRWDAKERSLFVSATLHALDGSGLPVSAWEEPWLWRALRNRVEQMERFVYDGVFRHVRPLAQTMARARRLNADDWATPRQTLPLARGFGEECNAWDSPARLWIVAAASV